MSDPPETRRRQPRKKWVGERQGIDDDLVGPNPVTEEPDIGPLIYALGACGEGLRVAGPAVIRKRLFGVAIPPTP